MNVFNVPLTTHEALSGIAGSISLASWIFLLVPQLFENYNQKSAAGVSLLFLFAWMIGDITNLIGAVWAELVPTVTALAVYFCIADTVLILQCIYYNNLNARLEKKKLASLENAEPNERDALIARANSDGEEVVQNLGLPGSRRRSSASRKSKTGSSIRADDLAPVVEEESTRKTWLRNTVSVFLILCAGTVGWAIAYKAGAWKPTPLAGPNEDNDIPIGAAILGYASAVLYLGARIPQVVKNYREKSCEGLSMLFFILSIIGNLTYGAGILLHSTEQRYFLKNLPWLIGSLGTMAEDAIIFYQFHLYGDKSSAIE